MKAPHMRLVVDASEGQGMSPAEFDRELQRGLETYGSLDGNEPLAKRDQWLAELICRSHQSGWTQEELAARVGQSRTWVVYHLRFGRFSAFATSVTMVTFIPPPDLTERLFRRHWEKTSKTDDENTRFAAVIRRMQEPATKTNWRKSPAPKTDKAREVVRPLVENGQPINRHEIAKEHDLTEATIQRAEYMERGRVEGLEEATEPEARTAIDTSILSKSAQEKFAVLERRLRAQYDDVLRDQVEREVKRHINETLMPIYKEKLEKAERVMRFQSGKPFTEAEFKIMLRALHPDSADNTEFRHAAWCLLIEKAYLLRPEKENPLSEGLPTSLAEARRRKAG